ncbi:DUF4372 domain-containing protein [Bacteroidota bacterium]
MIKITLLSQLAQLSPNNKFQNVVNKYQSNKNSKGLDSWTHMISMIFCRISQANSVRDISNDLRSITGNQLCFTVRTNKFILRETKKIRI